MKKLGNGCLDVCKFLQAEKVEFQLKLTQDTSRKAYVPVRDEKLCGRPGQPPPSPMPAANNLRLIKEICNQVDSR